MLSCSCPCAQDSLYCDLAQGHGELASLQWGLHPTTRAGALPIGSCFQSALPGCDPEGILSGVGEARREQPWPRALVS